MNKYKVGDKFIIEIAEVYENVLSGVDVFEAATSEPLYKIKGFNSLVFDKNGLDRLEEVADKKNFIASENIRVGDVVTVGGGDIKFIKYEDNYIYIKLYGACAHCLYQDNTINENLLSFFKDEIPEIKGIINVNF